MTYLQYLTTFIQLFIIITFSYLIFYSNNEKIQENFGRRSKTNDMNNKFNDVRNKHQEMSNYFRDLKFTYSGNHGHWDEESRKIKNRMNFSHTNRYKKRRGKWRNDQDTPSIYSRKRNVQDVNNELKRQAGFGGAGKRRSHYFSYGSLNNEHTNLKNVHAAHKKAYDDRIKAAKEAAEAQKKLEGERNARDRNIDEIVDSAKNSINPLFQQNVGKYKKQTSMPSEWEKSIRAKGGQYIPKDKWYTTYLPKARQEKDRLYNYRKKQLEDERIRIKNQALVNSINTVNRDVADLKKQQDAIDKKTNETNRLKQDKERQVANTTINYAKKRNQDNHKAFMKSVREERNTYHKNFRPEKYLASLATFYHNHNHKLGKKVIKDSYVPLGSSYSNLANDKQNVEIIVNALE
tara:strand:- start:304 stop:1518 length:1215 start_codon:yes stop_codon:yes gene_type:complete